MKKLARACIAIPPAILVGVIAGSATHPLLGFVACTFTYLATSALARVVVLK